MTVRAVQRIPLTGQADIITLLEPHVSIVLIGSSWAAFVAGFVVLELMGRVAMGIAEGVRRGVLGQGSAFRAGSGGGAGEAG